MHSFDTWYICVEILWRCTLSGMESTLSLLSEKHFLCSLCEEIFSNPVTTPCGHSFCKACLRVYWSRSGSDECPLCRKAFGSRPHISVNRILADVTENYRKTRLAAQSNFFSMDELQDEPVSTFIKKNCILPFIIIQYLLCFWKNLCSTKPIFIKSDI